MSFPLLHSCIFCRDIKKRQVSEPASCFWSIYFWAVLISVRCDVVNAQSYFTSQQLYEDIFMLLHLFIHSFCSRWQRAFMLSVKTTTTPVSQLLLKVALKLLKVFLSLQPSSSPVIIRYSIYGSFHWITVLLPISFMQIFSHCYHLWLAQTVIFSYWLQINFGVHVCTDQGLWIFSPITYNEISLGVIGVRKHQFQCLYGHLDIVLKQTWNTVNLLFNTNDCFTVVLCLFCLEITQAESLVLLHEMTWCGKLHGRNTIQSQSDYIITMTKIYNKEVIHVSICNLFVNNLQ